MMKTLGFGMSAMAGPLMIAAVMGIVTAPEAQAPHSGTGNDRTGNTVSNQGMMVVADGRGQRDYGVKWHNLYERPNNDIVMNGTGTPVDAVTTGHQPYDGHMQGTVK